MQRGMQKSSYVEYFCTLPTLLWLFFFFIIPLMLVISISLRPYDIEGNILSGWTLDSIRALSNWHHLTILWRTIWISLLTTLGSLLIAIPTGYAIARASTKVQKILLLLVILPFWSSFIVRIFAWKSLLHPEGPIKQLLLALNLVEPSTLLLYNSWVVVLVSIYTFLPFAILPIYSAASKFDYTLLDAGMDLGLTRLRTFLYIFLPNIREGIFTAAIIVLIPSLSSYVIPDIVGGPESQMIGNLIVERVFVNRNLPEACALAFVLVIVTLIPLAGIFYLQKKALRNKE